MSNTVRLDATDNVVTAVKPLEAGTIVEETSCTTMVPRGHKIATRSLEIGEPIRKYAQVIGYASQAIAPGDHVHTHNVEFRNTDAEHEFGTDLRPVQPATKSRTMAFSCLLRRPEPIHIWPFWIGTPMSSVFRWALGDSLRPGYLRTRSVSPCRRMIWRALIYGLHRSIVKACNG